MKEKFVNFKRECEYYETCTVLALMTLYGMASTMTCLWASRIDPEKITLDGPITYFSFIIGGIIGTTKLSRGVTKKAEVLSKESEGFRLKYSKQLAKNTEKKFLKLTEIYNGDKILQYSKPMYTEFASLKKLTQKKILQVLANTINK